VEWSDEKTRAGWDEQRVVNRDEERHKDDWGEEEGDTHESTPQKRRLYLMVGRVSIHQKPCKYTNTQRYRRDKGIYTRDRRIERRHT